MNISAKIEDEKIVLTIEAEYLERAFEMGVTTNCTGKVTDREEMLQHFKRHLEDASDDTHFGRCIDGICEDAMDSGASFVEPEDDDF